MNQTPPSTLNRFPLNQTRTGKIARLPHRLRDELNRRLQNGEKAKPLAAWLNSLSEVQTILSAHFDAKPIRPQNISEWAQGGYREWLLHQDSLHFAHRLFQDAAEFQSLLAPAASPSPHPEERAGERRPTSPVQRPSHPPLSDLLALWLASRYALATRDLAARQGAEHWHLLREICADVIELRRGDHAAERLRLARQPTNHDT